MIRSSSRFSPVSPLVRATVFIALSLPACSRPAERPAPGARDTTIVQGPVGARVNAYLERAARFGFSGAVLIAKEGKVVLRAGYGAADRDKNLPVTPNTVFSIGSLTKQFTAAAILSLEERKKLRTSDHLSRFFPDAPADKAGITLHQLLTHTAGFPDALGDDFDRIGRDSLVALAFRTPLLSPPGERYAYSNVGYSILAALIERVSGQPYEAYLRSNLLDRAGLTETGYNLPWADGRIAVGYRDTTRWGNSVARWQPDGPWWHVVGNGEIQSTVGDIYRWVAALDSGRVLTDSSRRKLITPYVPEDESGDTRYGYGWVVTTSDWGSQLIWHNGSNGIFYADVRRLPDDKTVVVFLTNCYPNVPYLKDLVHLSFGLPVPDIPAGSDSVAGDLSEYAGDYRLPSGATIPVRPARGRLQVVSADPEVGMAFVALTPTGAEGPNPKMIGESAATRMLDRTVHGDYRDLLAFLQPAPGTEQGLENQWKGWVSEWSGELGPYRGVRMIGSRVIDSVPPRRIEVYGSIRFERGATIVRFLEREGEGPQFRAVSPVPPGPVPPRLVWLVPTGPERFVTYLPSFGTALPVRFEGRGPGRTMILETPGRVVRATRS